MAGRNHLNNDEIAHLAKKIRAGKTFAEAVADLALTSKDIDTAGLAGFETHATALSKQMSREFTPGPELELEHLRTYAAPVPTAIDVASTPAAGGAGFVLTGHCFLAGATVKFGTVAAVLKTVRLTEIVGTFPAHDAAVDLDVVVTNPNTLTGTLAAAVTYT